MPNKRQPHFAYHVCWGPCLCKWSSNNPLRFYHATTIDRPVLHCWSSGKQYLSTARQDLILPGIFLQDQLKQYVRRARNCESSDFIPYILCIHTKAVSYKYPLYLLACGGGLRSNRSYCGAVVIICSRQKNPTSLVASRNMYPLNKNKV